MDWGAPRSWMDKPTPPPHSSRIRALRVQVAAGRPEHNSHPRRLRHQERLHRGGGHRGRRHAARQRLRRRAASCRGGAGPRWRLRPGGSRSAALRGPVASRRPPLPQAPPRRARAGPDRRLRDGTPLRRGRGLESLARPARSGPGQAELDDTGRGRRLRWGGSPQASPRRSTGSPRLGCHPRLGGWSARPGVEHGGSCRRGRDPALTGRRRAPRLHPDGVPTARVTYPGGGGRPGRDAGPRGGEP